MKWTIKAFSELSVEELYQIIRLRMKTFVDEQNCCAYEELDNRDNKCYHVFTYGEDENVVAYCRILPPGLAYEEMSIGRVAVDSAYRRNKLGLEMMNEAIRFIEEEMKETKIKISAQTYVIAFYKSLGFEVISEEYLEENIPHVKMKRG